MPKQSATNPRFRCNGCKDFHSAPEHNVHFQCAKHGYVCEKHIVSSSNCWVPFHAKQRIPKKEYGKCSVLAIDKYYKTYGWIHRSKKLKEVVCLNSLIKFNWHEDVGRWIEEGREEEEKAMAKPKTKSKTKPDYAKEIKVLVDLLEDDTLTKEVFIKKIREKLK